MLQPTARAFEAGPAHSLQELRVGKSEAAQAAAAKAQIAANYAGISLVTADAGEASTSLQVSADVAISAGCGGNAIAQCALNPSICAYMVIASAGMSETNVRNRRSREGSSPHLPPSADAAAAVNPPSMWTVPSLVKPLPQGVTSEADALRVARIAQNATVIHSARHQKSAPHWHAQCHACFPRLPSPGRRV